MKTIDLVGWLKNWFYTKEENYNKTTVDGLLTDKLNTNLGVANKNVVTDENGNVSLEEKSGNTDTITDIVLVDDGTINLKYVGDE